MMNFRPILFSTPMVQAILDGRKTQTRRVIKPQPLDVVTYADQRVWYPEVIKCPYEVGDVLWVRETFTNSEEYPFIFYKADADDVSIKWKPSIFMPKSACRLFLQVKSVRVERLQDITEEDAIAEGIERIKKDGMLSFRSYAVKHDACVYPYVSFQTLWHKINGPTSWVKNPWVWVIEFEKIEKPENFI